MRPWDRHSGPTSLRATPQVDPGPASTPLLASHYQPHPSTLLPRGEGDRRRLAKGQPNKPQGDERHPPRAPFKRDPWTPQPPRELEGDRAYQLPSRPPDRCLYSLCISERAGGGRPAYSNCHRHRGEFLKCLNKHFPTTHRMPSLPE